jgi:hypothetical protein
MITFQENKNIIQVRLKVQVTINISENENITRQVMTQFSIVRL